MHKIDHTFTLAPMMDWSDRHCRYFWRLLTRRAPLYTEMVTTGALIHGDRERFLFFRAQEHPVALQLGGSDPADLARCARWAQDYGYDEVNLNCGCPSDRVQSGAFGACLMAQPQRVANCIAAMRNACDLPVTVKHRIGIDAMQHYESLVAFVAPIAAAGCDTFIVHARKAWLQGLSPKENRDIPPLNYDWVYQLKRDFPALEIIINGGIRKLEECDSHLGHVDGVMLGREAYQNPWLLSQVDSRFYAATDPVQTPLQVVDQMLPYIESELASGSALKHITRHMMGLFAGRPGARRFRRHLSENAHRPGADVRVLQDAVQALQGMAA